jgi:transcriptional regulator with XRE-family HTH domain
VNRLREYRERYGWTQAEVVAEIHRRVLERGDPVAPGLDQAAVSRHENGHKKPCPRNRALYCELFGADATELGDPVAQPRNQALDLINLADVLAQRRKVEEGAVVAMQAKIAAADIDSGRVSRGLRDVAQRLGPYRGNPSVGEFLALV